MANGQIANVILPESVTEIRENAFTGCMNLKTVTLPRALKCIGKGAFLTCKSLNSIVIPEGTEEIGESAFQNCESLTRIAVPDSVRSLSSVAFHTSGLTDIIIGERVGSIGVCVFGFCEALRTIRMRADDPLFPRRYCGIYSMDTDLEAVWEMHKIRDYSGKAHLSVKLPIMMLDYLHTRDAKITACIKANLDEIMTECISAGDIQMMNVFVQAEDFLNQTNIDRFIRTAQDSEQPEIMMLLMNYKNARIGFTDSELKL